LLSHQIVGRALAHNQAATAGLPIRDAWWMNAFPSFALSSLVLALNVVGDAVNTSLNPKTRGIF
jgi:ABC-type dipeptide/oligopeptide/nickel transport system permease subunit